MRGHWKLAWEGQEKVLAPGDTCALPPGIAPVRTVVQNGAEPIAAEVSAAARLRVVANPQLLPVGKAPERGLQVKTASKVGSAGETIAKFADAGKYDLLMMGSHGNSALGNLVMGSVATKVLAGCGVPVLLVR